MGVETSWAGPGSHTDALDSGVWSPPGEGSGARRGSPAHAAWTRREGARELRTPGVCVRGRGPADGQARSGFIPRAGGSPRACARPAAPRTGQGLGQGCGGAGGGVRWGQESPERPDSPAPGRGAPGGPPSRLVRGTEPPGRGGWAAARSRASRPERPPSPPPLPEPHPEGDGPDPSPAPLPRRLGGSIPRAQPAAAKARRSPGGHSVAASPCQTSPPRPPPPPLSLPLPPPSPAPLGCAQVGPPLQVSRQLVVSLERVVGRSLTGTHR